MSIDEITNYKDIDNIIKIAFEKLKKQENKAEIEKGILELLFISNITKRYDLIADIYISINNNSINLDIYQFEIILGEFIQINKENFCDISKILSELTFESDFLSTIKFMNLDLNGDEYAKELLKKIIKESELKNPYVKTELAYGVLKYNINQSKEYDLIEVFLEKDFNKYQLLEHSHFCQSVITSYMNNVESKKEIKYTYLILKLLEYFLEEKIATEKQIYEIYEIYKLEIPNITSAIYNKKYINEKNIVIYPSMIRFGYFLNRANNYEEAGEKRRYIQMLKKAVIHYPYMEVVISDILKQLEDEIIVEDQRKQEFEELSVKIKQKIYELIALGQKEEALSVICQLQSIIPKDRELKEIKSRLSIF